MLGKSILPNKNSNAEIMKIMNDVFILRKRTDKRRLHLLL